CPSQEPMSIYVY
nr:Chain C, CPS peptide from 65 kDa lower matrix phosphoprotein [synthetic construct]